VLALILDRIWTFPPTLCRSRCKTTPTKTVTMLPGRLAITGLFLFIAAPVLAQDTAGNLEGRVVDPKGSPIGEVMVVVDGPAQLRPREGVTQPDGSFLMTAVPVGRYKLVFRREGYHETKITEVIVLLGLQTTVGEVVLHPTATELPDMIVYGNSLPVDPVSTAVGTNLTPQDFEPLPVDRNYRSIGLLTPQWEESFLGDEISVAGGTGNENRFYVDGVDVTDPIFGRASIRLPYNLIREIQVKTGGYEAEYRSTLGGIQNMITYTGGNEWHYRLFGFYTGDGLSQEERTSVFERPGGSFTEYDVGFSMGGPLVRNKLWLFGAYNPTISNRNVETPGFGYGEDKETAHVFATKLTWDPAQSTRVTVSLFGDPTSRDGVDAVEPGVTLASLDPVLINVDEGGYAGIIRAEFFLGDESLVELSLSRTVRQYRQLPATERGWSEPQFMDRTNPSGVVILDGGSWRTDDFSGVNQITLKGMTRWASHTVKAGLEYKQVSADVNHFWQVLVKTAEDSYFEATRDAVGTVGNRLPSAFVQDSWRLHPDFRLNMGLRWDGQNLVASDGKVRQKINDQFQPRLGLVWQPGDSQLHRFFGSYGRFYQELATTISDFYHIQGALTSFIIYDADPRQGPANEFRALYDVIELEDAVDNLRGQYHDEFTLGYERKLDPGVKVGLTGTYRALGSAIEDGHVESRGGLWYGNPGRGELAPFPEARREYFALTLSLQKARTDAFNYLVSYTLSRTEGNYPGLFNTDFGYPNPNANGSFDYVENTIDGDGVLPNDRPHRLKLYGSYRFPVGLTVGTTFLWQSGTPLSVFAEAPFERLFTHDFAEPRGTVGRTPSIWDLNLRFAYELPFMKTKAHSSRVLLDIFHLGNPRTEVSYDQVKFYSDGSQNPTYGLATGYQPAMTVRAGIEIGF